VFAETLAAIAGVLILDLEKRLCKIHRAQYVVHRPSYELHAEDGMQDNNSIVVLATQCVKGLSIFNRVQIS